MGFQLEPNERMLIVAPHPDDESIGCGGLLALYGPQCDVLLLTDGRRGKSKQRKHLSDEEIIAIRANELKDALTLTNVHGIIQLGIPDGELKKRKRTVLGFDMKPYRYIFVPNSKEMHPDHQAACRMIKSARFWGKTRAKVYEYEVWTPLPVVDVLIDISSVKEVKEKMIRKHVSQLECKDYLNAAMGLSSYRGLSCNSSAGEAFYRSPASLLDKIKKWVHLILKF